MRRSLLAPGLACLAALCGVSPAVSQTLADYEKSLSLIARRHRDALLRAVDVQLGRNNVASAERAIRSATLQRDEAARALQILLGRYPSGEMESRSELPTLKRNVPAGLPSAGAEAAEFCGPDCGSSFVKCLRPFRGRWRLGRPGSCAGFRFPA